MPPACSLARTSTIPPLRGRRKVRLRQPLGHPWIVYRVASQAAVLPMHLKCIPLHFGVGLFLISPRLGDLGARRPRFGMAAKHPHLCSKRIVFARHCCMKSKRPHSRPQSRPHNLDCSSAMACRNKIGSAERLEPKWLRIAVLSFPGPPGLPSCFFMGSVELPQATLR